METITGSLLVRWHNQIHTKGFVVEGHEHLHDHTTFYWGIWKLELYGFHADPATGKPTLGADGKKVWFSLGEEIVDGDAPGSWRLIKASIRHRMTLLSPTGKYACVYSHRTREGEVVEHYTGWHQHYG